MSGSRRSSRTRSGSARFERLLPGRRRARRRSPRARDPRRAARRSRPRPRRAGLSCSASSQRGRGRGIGLFRIFTDRAAEPWLRALPGLTGRAYRRSRRSTGGTMKDEARNHDLPGGRAGRNRRPFVGATKSVQLGHAGGRGARRPSARSIAQRRPRSSTGPRRSLQQGAAQKPPKLPPLPGAAPAGSARRRSAAAPRVVYVRPAPLVVTIHRAGGEHEATLEARGASTKAEASSMTSHVARLYALAPRPRLLRRLGRDRRASVADARRGRRRIRGMRRSQLREQRLRAESLAVKRIVDRRWAVYRAQLALRKRESRHAGAERQGASPRWRSRGAAAAPVRACRHPAAADDHEDVVMLRRAFQRDGHGGRAARSTPAGRRERARVRRGPSRVRAAGGAAVALPAGLGALGAQPRRRDRRGADLARGRRGSPSRRASGPAAGSTRPCTTRSSPPATTGRSPRCPADGPAGAPRRCGGGVRIDGPPDRARAGLPARPRRDRARATRSSAPPRCSRTPGPAWSTRAATSPCRGGPGRSVSRPATGRSRSGSTAARSPPRAATAAAGAAAAPSSTT